MLMCFWVPRVYLNKKIKVHTRSWNAVWLHHFLLYNIYFKPNILLQIKTSAPVTHFSTEGTEADRKNILRANPLEKPAAPSAITLTKILLAKNTHSHRSKQHKWKYEKNKTRKEKWIRKYNEKRVWVEREESWECKIAPPSGNRIILWADGSSLCVGWHFPVTPSQVMLCDVCDWLLPGPWEATEPRGHLLSARSILGIVYFSFACPVFFFASSLHSCHLPPLLLSMPSPALVRSLWPGGVYFRSGKDAFVFSRETKPFLAGNSCGVTQNHAFSAALQTVSVAAPFSGQQMDLNKNIFLKNWQRYMLLNFIFCCVWWW